MNPRDLARATWGNFSSVGAYWLLLTADLSPIASYAIFAGGAVGAVYLLVGLWDESSWPQSPRVGKFWPAVSAIGAGFLLFKGIYLPPPLGAFNPLLQALYMATLAASIGRLGLSLDDDL
jgi:hypothetical protein